ncbi:MAG: cytosolic protein [Firmicutes bacterium]|nr:cytosolic protein [Bacillota bacterium]
MSLPQSPAPQPSKRARELVRGAYDLHVHSGPDVLRRRIHDLDLARRCKEVGLRGYVIKSHYTATAGRAFLASAAVDGVRVLGSVVLNALLGGMNPMTIEIAAREGARLVWMPTVDSVNERRLRGGNPQKPPFWAKLQDELRDLGVESPPVHVVDETGSVLPETRQVLRRIAHHNLVLATGHLSRDEIFAVVDASIEEGVKHIIITHPDFPTQNLSVDDQKALAERGAYLERCFTTAYTGKVSWERMFANIRATGVEANVLSTDLGQPTNPPVEDGLALMADKLLEAGFSEEEVRVMAVQNTVRLAEGTER